MASAGRDGRVTDAAGSQFPAVRNVDRESNPGHKKHVEGDPISSDVASSLEATEQAKRKAIEEEHKQAKKKESMQTVKTTFIVSGVIAAVAVAAIAVLKKLRQT